MKFKVYEQRQKFVLVIALLIDENRASLLVKMNLQ